MVVENPMTSELWSHPIARRWCGDGRHTTVHVDLCQFDMKSKDGREYLKKPLRLLTTHEAFNEHIGKSRMLGAVAMVGHIRR